MINKNILTFIIFWFLCLSSTDIKGISENSSYFTAVLQYNNSDLMKHLKYAITDSVHLKMLLLILFHYTLSCTLFSCLSDL